MSRFYRIGLPSPKTYLAGMRLLHAAYLFLNPGLSVSDVAYRLDYSSPQSFGRHLKAMLGVTAGEFRRRFPFDVSLARYVDLDRKSTRLNSSHLVISYAVFCLK